MLLVDINDNNHFKSSKWRNLFIIATVICHHCHSIFNVNIIALPCYHHYQVARSDDGKLDHREGCDPANQGRPRPLCSPSGPQTTTTIKTLIRLDTKIAVIIVNTNKRIFECHHSSLCEALRWVRG